MAVIAGLWCGALGVLILLSFALTLNLAFEAHSAAWLHEAFVVSGMTDAGAFVDDPPRCLSACQAEQSEFRELFERCRRELVAAFEPHRPSDRAYSPLS